MPLPWATGAEMWCRVRDFHPQPLRPERSASCSCANAAKWYSRQDSHLHLRRSKRRALVIQLRERERFQGGRTRRQKSGLRLQRDRLLHCFSVSPLPPCTGSSTAAATEPPAEIGGSPRCCPVLCGLRDRCIAAMLATPMPVRKDRDTKAELNHCPHSESG